MNIRKLKILAAALLLAVAFQPARIFACAACYGASDSPMAKGMNWGIFSLLGVVGVVLACIATFFVFIGKKSAETPISPESDSEQQSEPSEEL